MSQSRILFHGGMPGMRRGDVILPNMAEHRCVEGCPWCEAQKRGETLIDPPTPPDWVCATTHRLYARYYASRAVRGDLYQVRLEGDVEESTEDQFPTWRGRRAIVLKILERRILLTMRQRRHLFRLWGGTDAEFDLMIEAVKAELA